MTFPFDSESEFRTMTTSSYVLTILAERFTDQSLAFVIHDFHKRPAATWLLDASAVVQYDANVLKRIASALERLSTHGLRTVALVHPSPLVQTVLRGMVLPVQLRVFAARALAQDWIQKGCPACESS